MQEPLGSEHPAHMFWLMMPAPEHQSGLITHLRQADIVAAFHYQALNLSPAGQRLARTPAPCPVSERASTCLVRLPLHADLTYADVERVVDTVRSYRVAV
jgi:dTDP-4-amino-4,6-dideoxygalactose transaminase